MRFLIRPTTLVILGAALAMPAAWADPSAEAGTPA